MKNEMLGLIILILSLILGIFSCKKDSSATAKYSSLTEETNNAGTASGLAQAYNDSLIMVFDTACVRRNNLYCIRYDKLYHKNDSIFSGQYQMFGNAMYGYGVTMMVFFCRNDERRYYERRYGEQYDA